MPVMKTRPPMQQRAPFRSRFVPPQNQRMGPLRGKAPSWNKLQNSDDSADDEPIDDTPVVVEDVEKKKSQPMDEWEKMKQAKAEKDKKDSGEKKTRYTKRKIHMTKEIMDQIQGKGTINANLETSLAHEIMFDLPKMPAVEKEQMTYMTFDPILCHNSVTIPTLYANSKRFKENDHKYKQIEAMMIQRFKKVTPSVEQRAIVKQLQTTVTRAFEALLDTPLARSGTLPLCAYAEVGSFAKNTVMVPNLTADCAVIMKVKPTREAVKRLSEHFLIQFNRLNSVQLYRYDIDQAQNVYLSDENTSTPLQIEFLEEGGFEINNEEANVKVMIGCMKHKMNMGIDTNLHINKVVLQAANAAVEHVKWFHEKIVDNSTRILIVLLKDLCIRFESFRQGLNPRTIELISYYAIHEIPSKADQFEYY